MTHDEALRHGVAGGPLPQEAQAHLNACPDCAAELEALRAVERRLSRSAPRVQEVDLLAGRVLARVRRSRPRGWAMPSAAALALAVGLWAAWLSRPGEKLPSTPPAELASASAVLDISGGADTTADLLGAYETEAASLGTVPPEALKGILSATEDGG